jgi:hypothetical protein
MPRSECASGFIEAGYGPAKLIPLYRSSLHDGATINFPPWAGAGTLVEARSTLSHSNRIRVAGSFEPSILERSRLQTSLPMASTGWRMDVRGGVTACIQE